MMTLFSRLQDDMKTAMKAKNVSVRDVLRLIISNIKNAQIDATGELQDDVVIKIIKKEIKQIHETIASYGDTNPEAVATEQTKIDALSGYLPEMMSEDTLREILATKIAELGIDDVPAAKGRLIGVIMKEQGSSVDGGMLNQMVSSRSA